MLSSLQLDLDTNVDSFILSHVHRLPSTEDPNCTFKCQAVTEIRKNHLIRKISSLSITNCSFLQHVLLSSLSLIWQQKFPRQMPQNLWQL